MFSKYWKQSHWNHFDSRTMCILKIWYVVSCMRLYQPIWYGIVRHTIEWMTKYFFFKHFCLLTTSRSEVAIEQILIFLRIEKYFESNMFCVKRGTQEIFKRLNFWHVIFVYFSFQPKSYKFQWFFWHKKKDFWEIVRYFWEIALGFATSGWDNEKGVNNIKEK